MLVVGWEEGETTGRKVTASTVVGDQTFGEMALEAVWRK